MKCIDFTDTKSIPAAIQLAADILQKGGVVLFPTDTVYGLAASAFNQQAIERLFQIKERDSSKSIAVLLGDTVQSKLLAESFPPAAQRLANRYWPGGITLIVSKLASLPPALSANEKIGIRIPDYPAIRELIRITGPLATTSANHSGDPPAKSILELPPEILESVDLVLDGGSVKIGISSTVVDCTETPVKILREGSIPASEIIAAALER